MNRIIPLLLSALFSIPPQLHAEDAIRIGSILSLSGPIAAIGEGARRGQQLAIEDINNSGGINGRNIEVIYEDSAGEPARAVSALNKLAAEVTYPIIYSSLTSVAQAIKPLTEKRGTLLFMEAGLTGILDGTKLAVRNFADFKLIYQELRNYVESKNIKKVALLIAEEEWAESSLKGFTETGKNEVQIVAKEYAAKGITDLKPQLMRLKAKSADAELLIIMLIGSAQAAAINQASQLGITLPKATSYLCSQTGILSTVGDAYNGNVTIEGQVDFTSPLYQTFLTRYEAMFKSRHPEFNSLTSYDSLMILADALRAGATTPQAIKDYIVSKKQFIGVLGTTTFNSQGDAIRGGMVQIIKDRNCIAVDNKNSP
jgi:branched-chain amino acid transport system substrate-binding protein